MTPPRYTPRRLLLLAAVLVGTLALMTWLILSNQGRARADRDAPPPAQENARQPSLPRE